ncbi:MAG: hypothetical protein ACYTFQ_28850 [Planctomycetota bacterium]|jgi:hypothetical protein
MENQNLPSLRLDRGDGPYANQDIPVLCQKMHSMINLDEPIPVIPLSRHLVAICLVGIERAPNLSARRNWIETMNRVLRTGKEISEQGDIKTDKKTMMVLETLVEGSQARWEAEDAIEKNNGKSSQGPEGQARASS